MIAISQQKNGSWSIKIEPGDLLWNGETWGRNAKRMLFRTREEAERYFEIYRDRLEAPFDGKAKAGN